MWGPKCEKVGKQLVLRLKRWILSMRVSDEERSTSHRQRGVRLLLLVAGAVLACVSLYLFRAFFVVVVLLLFCLFVCLFVFCILWCTLLKL